MQLRMRAVLLAVAVVGCKVEVPADKEFVEFRDVAVDVDVDVGLDVAVGTDAEADGDAGSELAVGTDAADGVDALDAVDAEDADALQDAAEVDVAVDAAEVDVGTDASQVEVAPDVAEAEVAQPCSPADCDDSNDCTVETCDGAKGCVSLPSTASCSDGDACTVGDACKGGACLPGAVTACDDGNGCTSDKCNKALGCVYTANSLGCSDGDACTAGDSCKDGACLPGAACDDGNGCTTDSCDKTQGCVYSPNSLTCTDGDACTVGDVCKAAGCFPGETVKCDDGNPCTTDSCDPAKGCVAVANNKPCDDGNACTCADQCSNGTCKSGANTCTCASDGDCAKQEDGNLCNGTLFCDKSELASCGPGKCCTTSCKATATVVCDTSKDGPCKATACLPLTGKCVAAAKPEGTGCDADGSVCTGGDACKGGVCLAGAVTKCDDGNPCTTDSCDKAQGCVYSANLLACSDGDACTVGDKCDGQGNCTGVAVGCDDGNPCTDDACANGVGCLHAANAKTCDDGQVCTVADVCAAMKCAGVAKVCDDKNACTVDLCDAVKGCVSLAASGACSDGDACTVGDACGGGVCLAGPATLCSDGNTCTDDSCDKVKGCTSTPNTGTCSDGNACTSGDVCSAGSCGAGVAVKCDDGNVCTDDSCLAESGCKTASKVDGAACDDGNPCTKNDTCGIGKCAAGKPLVWTKKISTSGNSENRPFGVIQDATGWTILNGIKVPTQNPFYLHLVHLDATGAATWQTGDLDTTSGFCNPNSFYQGSLSKFADGSYLVAGGWPNSCAGGVPFWTVWRYGANGEKQWQVNYKPPAGGEIVLSAIASADSVYLVGSGSAWCDTYTCGAAHIVRMTATGTVVWVKTHGYTGSPTKGFDISVGAVAALGSDLVFAGQRDGKGWLVRVGPDGTIIADVVTGLDLKLSVDESGSSLFGLGPATATKFSYSLAPQWSTKLNTAGTIANAIETQAHGVVLWTYSAGGKRALARMDANGNLEWSREFGLPSGAAAFDAGGAVSSDASGVLVATGAHWEASSSYHQPWVMRADSWGNATCTASGPCAAKTLTDCADTNPCTADLCDAAHNGCYHQNLPDWSPCGAGKICDGKGTCSDVATAKSMALIPAGSFKMGCVPGDTACLESEKPQHTVALSAYYLDLYEVSAAQYQACVQAGKCSSAGADPGYCTSGKPGKDQHPVNCVSLEQAGAYCKWTAATGRLPTEAEWERAARGGLTNKKFPWGDEPPTCNTGQKNSVVWTSGGTGCGKGGTWPVGTGSAPNGFGMYDMAGNVWEWVSDWYDPGYYSTSPVTDPQGPATGTGGTSRGGAFSNSDVEGLRASKRSSGSPVASPHVGFRCAKSYP